jgi:AcrR family transcriptional regulator
MQEIADAVQVTKKTLFNRYISKENMELCLIDYWQKRSCERMAQRMEFANHAVEKLMMFLFELQYCRNNETIFFLKAKEVFLGNYEQNSPYIKQLEDIFTIGAAESLFRFDTELKVFAYFFQFNALFILLNNPLVNTEYISFLFEPILTDAGRMVFQDIDIEQIFKS